MSAFPCMIYQADGQHEIHGVMVDYCIVDDQEALDTALAEGWALTPTEATLVLNYPETTNQPAAYDAPPTRAELETMARELGITFDGRTNETKLTGKIAAALKA